MNEKLLAALGLTPSETKIYEAILKAGEIAPVGIAKTTGIKRTTAYAIARALSEKGLIIENSTKRPRTFAPASPKDIEGLITDERERATAREKMLRELSQNIVRTKAEKTYPVPQIRFIEEEKIGQFLYKQTAAWWSSMLHTDTTWRGFQDHTFVDHFKEWIDWQWKEVPKAITLKLLSNRSETEAKMIGKYPRRAIKFWEKTDGFISTTWIVGDYVVMINTSAKPFYLVEIHSSTLAHDQREVFKNLWPLV